MALEGALKFFPGIKIEPEQELCFQGLVVLKERCTQSMEKPHIPASAETPSPGSEYWFHKTETKKTISMFQISKF